MFRQISVITGDRMMPINFFMDFDLSQKGAVEELFWSAQVNGCCFHLFLNILQEIANSGLIKLFGINEQYHHCRLLTALSMVPEAVVVTAFEALVKWGGVSKEFDPILSWFEFNYIGILDTQTRGCSRKSPRIPIDFWNIHSVIVEDIPRCNTSMYYWNKSFRSALRRTNPTLENHINMIQKEERIHYKDMKMVHEDELYRPKSKKRRCDDLVEKMAKGIDSYNGGFVLYLLHAAKLVIGIKND